MHIRDLDYNRDKEEVVSLIRENLQPKFTEDTLVWKHQNNPFGRSTSKVAVEEGKIVGVVFSMRYEFRSRSGRLVKGIRTFDGCTDKNQRGKGIFKKLMQENIDSYAGDYDFLMANPNEASFPEHIKLGYVEAKGDLYYRFGILSPLFRSGDGQLQTTDNNSPKKQVLDQQDFLLTGNTSEFINWRYQDPVYTVKIFSDSNNQNNYLIYRKEKLKGFNSIILCDFFGDSSHISECLRKICWEEKTFLVYFLENAITNNIKLLYTKKHRKAFVVFKPNNFKLPDNLVISLGDMEGRL